jgi:hypothetical protein
VREWLRLTARLAHSRPWDTSSQKLLVDPVKRKSCLMQLEKRESGRTFSMQIMGQPVDHPGAPAFGSSPCVVIP